MFAFSKRSAALDKKIRRTRRLADKAHIKLEQIMKRPFTQEYYETQDRAYIGIEYADEALDLGNKIESELQNNFKSKISYRIKTEKKIEEISERALEAKQRIMEFIFGIKELEGAKILERHAKEIIDAAEYKMENGEMDNDGAIDQSSLAVQTADDALRKLQKSKEKFAFAHRKLAAEEIDALDSRLKEAEIKTLYTRNRAVKLLENEKHKINVKKAEERRNNLNLITLKFSTAVFDVNDAILTGEAEKTVKDIADELTKYEYGAITVEGHTDDSGTYETNLALSKQRAIAVRDKLVEYGVPENKINYAGLAATMPEQTNVSEEGRVANRRAVIFVE
jgi:outer membrane protein OmpA-like peptidoglycan-associated protein